MIAIDIETTGLDPEKHQILEFAAVAENGDFFHRLIKWENYVISQYCLKLHKWLLKEIDFYNLDYYELCSLADRYSVAYFEHTKTSELIPKLAEVIPQVIDINDLGHQFTNWLYDCHIESNYDVVGVNFAGFDAQFLKKVPDFPKWNYRVLELGSLYFDGFKIPGLKEIEPIDNAHRALPDAQATMRAFLRKRSELQASEAI